MLEDWNTGMLEAFRLFDKLRTGLAQNDGWGACFSSSLPVINSSINPFFHSPNSKRTDSRDTKWGTELYKKIKYLDKSF